MGWWIALWILLALGAIITVLIFLPVGIRVIYRNGELQMWYTIGPIRLLRYPQTQEEKEKRQMSKLTVRTVLREPIKVNQKYDSLLGEFMAELKTTLELFWALRPKLRIKRLVLRLVLAGDDPASVAMQYGGAWAAIGGLFPVLDGGFTIKKHDIAVNCDFSNGSSTTLEVRLDIAIGLGRLISRLFRYTMDSLDTITQSRDVERR